MSGSSQVNIRIIQIGNIFINQLKYKSNLRNVFFFKNIIHRSYIKRIYIFSIFHIAADMSIVNHIRTVFRCALPNSKAIGYSVKRYKRLCISGKESITVKLHPYFLYPRISGKLRLVYYYIRSLDCITIKSYMACSA